MGHGKHGSRHGSRSPGHAEVGAIPSAEVLGAAERIQRNTAAHWRTLIDDPDHPGQQVEMQAYAQRQGGRSHRLERGRVPSEP